jgi:hypothetical protein
MFWTLFLSNNRRCDLFSPQVPAQELLENTLATTTSESGWSRLKSHISSGKTENNKQDTLANIRMAGE